MARREKVRNVESEPEYLGFMPEGVFHGQVSVLSMDEYECLRLIDYESLNQQDAAEKLGVARTTVTAIYEKARFKLADALVNGKRILIAGGTVRFTPLPAQTTHAATTKGSGMMRVAVTYEDGQIFQHFGRTQAFKLFDIEDNAVASTQIISNGDAGHGALVDVLSCNQVDVLICGGLGGGARDRLAHAGIELYAGASGDADQAVASFLAGELARNAEITCNHHGHGHAEGSCHGHEGHGSCHGGCHGHGHGHGHHGEGC